MEFEAFSRLFPDVASTPEQLAFWTSIGEGTLDRERWAELYEQGLALFVAHHAMVSKPGQVSSRKVDGVAVTYDTTSSALEGGGHWNLTVYGQRYLSLARLVGAGGFQR